MSQTPSAATPSAPAPANKAQPGLMWVVVIVSAVLIGLMGYLIGQRMERFNAYDSYVQLLLGASLQEAGGDIYLQDVNPVGPAYMTGLRDGDRLDRIGRERITSVNQAYRLLREYQPGDEALITIDHDPIINQYTILMGFFLPPGVEPYPVPLPTIEPQPGQFLDARLGVYYRDVSPGDSLAVDQGALIISVGSPAAEAGLRVGDIITSVDGVQVNASLSLDAILDNHYAGDRVRLMVNRSGSSRTIAVTLGSS